eukprot:4959193-Amphidinium_carterae.2
MSHDVLTLDGIGVSLSGLKRCIRSHVTSLGQDKVATGAPSFFAGFSTSRDTLKGSNTSIPTMQNAHRLVTSAEHNETRAIQKPTIPLEHFPLRQGKARDSLYVKHMLLGTKTMRLGNSMPKLHERFCNITSGE